TPSHKTLAFFVAAGATIWLLGRYRGRLTAFEQLALLLMLVGGLDAIRSIIWFALTGIVVLPRLLDGVLERLDFVQLSRYRAIGAATAMVVIAGTLVFGATRPSSWYERTWPGEDAR